MDDLIFAEIEIEPKESRSAAGEAALRFFNSAAPPQTAIPRSEPIKPRIIDPIREKFYEMRKLAIEKPFARSDSELFYKQARFMEDFTDTYGNDAKFNMYYPIYQHMGYEYLRTYFTWRTKVRSGDIQPTSLSYIFLYIYELLSGIGTTDPADGLDKLLVIWDTFAKNNPTIDKYLPKWFKDYHIFYELPHSFTEFVEKNNLQKYYSLTLLFDENVENKLELWNGISGYDAIGSRFYKDGNEHLMNDCFNAVLNAIQEFCAKRNTRFEDLLVYSVSKKSPWQPFKQAHFGSRVHQTDREIKISEFERYSCKHGQWTANLPIYYSSQKDFVGYVLKKTEACLRQAVNYKYKLVADIKSGSKPFRELQRPAAKRAELDKVIEKAVIDFHKNLNRIAVNVDHINLARIRSEALDTQEQLIVVDDVIETGTVLPTTNDENSTYIADRTVPKPACLADLVQPLTLSFADGWKALKNNLTDIERKALSIALTAGTGTKAFADENNIMLEVLADSINEKATDCIGDSLLEVDDELILYDEYRENIEGLV